MKPTKEQRAELAKRLSYAWGEVSLLCDGYLVTLQVQRDVGNAIRYVVSIYINGHFKGEWMKGDAPEAKFLRKQVRRLYSPAKCREIEKIVGKRRFANDPLYAGFRDTITQYLPWWSSGKAAIDHLCRVCESVEIAPAEAEKAAA